MKTESDVVLTNTFSPPKKRVLSKRNLSEVLLEKKQKMQASSTEPSPIKNVRKSENSQAEEALALADEEFYSFFTKSNSP